MMTGLHEFSLFFKVADGAALIKAGRERLIEDGAVGDMAEACETIADDDYALAARMLLDPGSLPGIEIIDSTCE